MTNPNERITLRILAIPLFIGLLVSLPLWIGGMPTDDYDFMHHSRLSLGFYRSITEGDFYPSWISITNEGYGDPSCRFYPPGLYLMLSVSHLLLGDWYFSFIATFTLLNILGATGLFFWAFEITGNKAASVVGTVVFLLAPFLANTLFNVSMFGQYAAGCLMPFVFYFIDRLFRQEGWRNATGLGVSLATVVYFHVPMALFCAICTALYALILWLQNRKFSVLMKLSVGALLGAMLSAAYWVTMLAEVSWKRSGGAGQNGWYDYRRNFIFQKSPSLLADWWNGMLVVVLGILFIPALILLVRKEKASYKLFALAGFSFFMATPASRFIWDAFTFLQETQFPWRWLTVTTLFVTLLISLAYQHLVDLSKTRYKPLAVGLLVPILVSVGFTASMIIAISDLQSRENTNRIVTSSLELPTNKDFLPIWTRGQIDPMDAPVRSNRTAKIVDWNDRTHIFEIEAGTSEQVRVKLLYYPLWRATTESGEVLEILPDKDGALLVTLPTERARISIKFVEPPTSMLSNIVSLIGLLIFGAILMFARKQETTQINDLQ